MNKNAARSELVCYWWGKAEASLESAEREYEAGASGFAINRVYYAAFYAATAWMIENGKVFNKHSGVRQAFHRELIKPGLIDKKWSKFYDRVFEDRNEGDYVPLTAFDDAYVRESIDLCREFLAAMRPLIRSLEEW